jgi:hypothetical protein
MGCGMGAGGSAWADGAVGNAITDAEINEMAKTTRTFPPKRRFRRTGLGVYSSAASSSAI